MRPAPSLWPGMLFLVALCSVFYVMLWFASGGASPVRGQNVQLSLGFCLIFSLFLGVCGQRVTRRLWPATLVHVFVAAVLLLMEVPLPYLLANVDVTLMLLAVVGVPTAIGSLLALLRRPGRSDRSDRSGQPARSDRSGYSGHPESSGQHELREQNGQSKQGELREPREQSHQDKRHDTTK